ncbi:DNA-processing protein DprA [Lewinella sp. W8]|uniref:DNA-processing protein DprA n=1 Tax=Lewinella sp. W8 TaxID=2528208 RepID=UPI00106747C8|nr:DNA-processing protein DprA [Lewinella sp. W8]MTB53668.1 DNA-protecting protein DprA [Lewinella sp. W8]
MHPDTYYRLVLSRVPNVGQKLFRQLIDHFGSARDALGADAGALCTLEGIAEVTAAGFADCSAYEREAEEILHFADAHDIELLCCLDEHYPHRLRGVTGIAPFLYHHGTTDFSNPRSLAIVGTRQMSGPGARQVDRLLDPLVNFSPLIVSGLAYGVDAYAHRRCLQIGLPTLAVMGSGFQHVYPAAHARLARQMADQGGGVLTAYPHWRKPEREHFPARNRIVAALSDMTVVVESAQQGGSMITARMAHELGRPVGACPGRGGDPLSAGCNDLIKRGKAHLVESGEDLTALLSWKGAAAGRQRRLFDDLEPDELQLIDELRDREAVEIDQLRLSLQFPPGKLAGLLLGLEMKGLIAGLPGHRYRLSG